MWIILKIDHSQCLSQWSVYMLEKMRPERLGRQELQAKLLESCEELVSAPGVCSPHPGGWLLGGGSAHRPWGSTLHTLEVCSPVSVAAGEWEECGVCGCSSTDLAVAWVIGEEINAYISCL